MHLGARLSFAVLRPAPSAPSTPGSRSAPRPRTRHRAREPAVRRLLRDHHAALLGRHRQRRRRARSTSPPTPGCASPTRRRTSSTGECSDGLDNNSNGTATTPAAPSPAARCRPIRAARRCRTPRGRSPSARDGIDNDGDGHDRLRRPTDPGCYAANDPTRGRHAGLLGRRSTTTATATATSTGCYDFVDYIASRPTRAATRPTTTARPTRAAARRARPAPAARLRHLGLDELEHLQRHASPAATARRECPGRRRRRAPPATRRRAAATGPPTTAASTRSRRASPTRSRPSARSSWGLMRFHQRPVGLRAAPRATQPRLGRLAGRRGAAPCGGGFNAGDLLVTLQPATTPTTSSSGSTAGRTGPGARHRRRRASTSSSAARARRPLAGSLSSALTYLSDAKTARHASTGLPPYRVILLTDGAETCGGDPARRPRRSLAAGFPIYVIGFASRDAAARPSSTAIAAAGGTGDAPSSSTTRPASRPPSRPSCRARSRSRSATALDDNCNGLIDEGAGVYKECTAADQPLVCRARGAPATTGRCTCTADAQCGPGFICEAGAEPASACRPARWASAPAQRIGVAEVRWRQHLLRQRRRWAAAPR